MTASASQWRKWSRRAATMQRKSQDLLGDMIEKLGVDDVATDYCDNIINAATNLADLCDRQVAAKGSLK